MNKAILKLALIATLLTTSSLWAKPLKVQWRLRGGATWTGDLHGRSGENFILLQRPGKDLKPVGVGVNTIIELKFKVNVDAKDLGDLMEEKEFALVSAKLEPALKPFVEYDDIPSNLTPYNVMLMEAYYRTGDFDKTLAVAKRVAKDDRDPELQARSKVYQILAMIDAGKVAEAESLIRSFGWDKNLTEVTSPEQLYIMAKFMTLKKDYSEAMLYVARVIAFNSSNMDWMKPSELLCAEIYTEMGLYDSAEEICGQIEELYKGSVEYDQAKVLKQKIEKLRPLEKKNAE